MQHSLGVSSLLPGRAPFVYLDFCFYADCNFTCTYCRESNEKMSKGRGREAVERALCDFLKLNSAGVLKLSGYGEATLWAELPDAIGPWVKYFPTVQLISNGAGLHGVVERLCQFPNFQASITLDGHTPETDRFRTKGSASLHRKVVKTIDSLVANGTKVEINCVITQANAGEFDRYLEWVRKTWGSAPCVIPLPVRPTMGRTMEDIVDDLLATPEQVDRLEQVVVGRYAEFQDLLAPLAYLEALVRFMRSSKRASRCHVHRANFGVNTDLLALPCACAGDRLISPHGPISTVGIDRAVEQRRHGFLRQGNVGAKCRTCFTHYDILNLYFEGSISDEDLRRIPSLSHPETAAHVRAVKQQIIPYL